MIDDAIRMLTTPTPLRDPVLLAAFQGGGSLAPGVVAGLFERYEPEPIAEIVSDEFYDFTVVRPLARLVDGKREIAWPQIRFSKVALKERDLVVLSAIEPNVGWRRMARAIHEISSAFGIREAILLSSFTGATPHTRPIPMRWLAVSSDVPARFGRTARRPRYQGPATFSMALGTMLRDEGFTVRTLNAIVPFYLGVEPNPYAIRALARALESEFAVRFDLDEVERQIAEIERQAGEQRESSQQLRMFIANLEQQYDEMQGHATMTPSTSRASRTRAAPGLPSRSAGRSRRRTACSRTWRRSCGETSGVATSTVRTAQAGGREGRGRLNHLLNSPRLEEVRGRHPRAR